MKVLFLGYPDSQLIPFLERQGDSVIVQNDRFGLDWLELQKAEFLISYGYRYILKKEVLDRFSGAAINLHISYLPWNRGADPNFWSIIENSPKGVTIHYLDAGIDTGDIIAQKEVAFGRNETLKSSYELLKRELENLFMVEWPKIRRGTNGRTPQPSGGSYHAMKDKEPLLYLLSAGWDTPISVLEAYGAGKRR